MLDSSLRRVIAVDDGAFRPYDRFGVPVPGLSWLPLSTESEGGGAGCFAIRFAPGAVSQAHEHVETEEFYVLEGELTDSDGQVLKAGDFVSYAAGTKHYSRSPKGCVILVFLRRPNRRLDADGA